MINGKQLDYSAAKYLPMKNLLLLISLSLSVLTASSQYNINSVVEPEILVCGDSEIFTAKILNDGSNAATGITVQVDLPTGILYDLGSFSEITTNGGQAFNVSNTSSPVFSFNDLPAGDSIEFEISISAFTPAIAYQSSNVFRNTVTFNHSGGNESHLSDAYNILFPALNILSVTPSSQSAVSGDTVTRDITIVNAGYGRTDQIKVSDVLNNAGADLIGSNIGSLVGDTIYISGTDFNGFGNGDNFLDLGESITITEQFVLSGCASVTATSTIQAHWGCDNLQTSPNSYGNLTVKLKNPKLVVEAINNENTCVNDLNASKQLKIYNSGQGYAKNVAIQIYKSSGGNYDEDIYSAIDENSLTYQIGYTGAPIPFTAVTTPTRDDNDYSCLGVDPVGQIDYTLPFDIAPGDTIYINWEMKQCCISQCLDQGNMGWKYNVDYENYCLTTTYNEDGTGEGKTKLNMTIFTETPGDIDDGQTKTFNFIVSSHDNNLPIGDGAHYKVVFDLPNGLIWNNVPNALRFESNSASWAPYDVVHNTVANTVTARYMLPEPFKIEKSEIQIDLTGDCSSGATSGYKTVSMSIDFIADTTCSNGCDVNMICAEDVTTNLHCPLVNCEGIHFYAFDMSRTSYGLPDNDENGKPDASGSLDFTKIRRNRAMYGDTIQATFSGVVYTGSNFSSFDNIFASTQIELGTYLTPDGATVTVYDASTSSYLTCNNVTVSYVDNGQERTFRYSFLPGSSGCTGFSSFAFEQGDSIWLKADYKVTTNYSQGIEEVDLTNNFFASQLAVPWSNPSDWWSCETYNGRYTLIGYFYKNHTTNYYTVNACSKVVSQNFSMSIGDCCDNYHGGNLFPFEYRNWAHLKTVEVHVPNHYLVLDAYFKQKRTVATNASSTQTVSPITQTNSSLSTLIFDIEQYYEEFGGNVIASDDGFRGTVYLELAPTCDVAVNTYEDITWQAKFAQSDYLGGGESNWITTNNPDKIRFKPTSLSLNSTNPVQDGLGRSVTWNLSVTNTTSNTDAANAWLHFKSPSTDMEVLHVINASGDTIPKIGDIYQIGQVNKSSSQSFSIVGQYSGCSPDYIVAYSGYECTAYPDSFAYFSCPYTTYALEVEPKSAGAQARISGNTIGGDCNNVVEITVEMASVHFGYLDSIEVEVTPIGNSMTFLNSTGAFSYPNNTAFDSIVDPASISGGYLYKISDLSDTIHQNGLPGVTDLSSNTFKLRFQMSLDPNFAAGDYVQIEFRSTEICGTVIQPITLAYDPSIAFNANTLSGLTDFNTNTWGASWVDFNNDGFDDLFVSDYEVGNSSKLFKNNGDGTFSDHNAGSLTTETLNTVSSTWGDYDNDGDMDVFLSNNTGSKNMLYTNNGDETFSIDTNLIVNQYSGYCHNATWIDYDNDGYLDLFVTEFFHTRYNILYHNDGNGNFEKITNQIITTDAMRSIGSTWGDYDNDGDLDAFVPNINGENNALYRNDGGGNFTKITTGDVVNDGGNSVGCSWGDYNNDGYLDLFVANTGGGGASNFLYANDGNGGFIKVSGDPVVTDLHNSSGSSWIDVDNDGDLDLFVTNDLGDESVLYTNDGFGSFTKVDNPLTAEHGNSYPNAWSDYDNDGDMDVFIGNRASENDVVFTNGRASCKSWICLSLVGTTSNAAAIGAKVRVKANVYGVDIWQMRELSAQTGGGAGSQNSLRALIGLGDATNADSVIIEWPSGIKQYLNDLTLNACQTIIEPAENVVCGTIFNDANGNCIQDAGEQGIPNTIVQIMPGSRLTSTDSNGDFEIYLENGTYTVSPIASGNWSTTCSGSVNITLNDNDSCGIALGMTNSCTSPDLKVTVGSTAMRRGFHNTVSITYRNESPVEATNVTLKVEFDEEILPISADVPWTSIVAGDTTNTYNWFIDTIPAYSNVSITISDSVDQAATLGEFVFIKASFDHSNGDCNTNNDTYTEVSEVVGSVDPNDKLVYPTKRNGILQITEDTRLTYKIRFQNVGTYEASYVTIVDTLSSYLDPTSIEFLEMTHPFTVSLENNVLVWQVFGISLPDSASDLEGSQGFVSFSIKPKANTPHNALVINRAAIQFDFNEYIITNRVYTKVVSMDVLNEVKLKVKIYPNPTLDATTIELLTTDEDNYVPIQDVHIYTIQGRLIKTIPVDFNEKVRIDLSQFDPGIYSIRVEDIFGRLTAGSIIKI